MGLVSVLRCTDPTSQSEFWSRPVAEVLRHLTSAKPQVHMGPDQDDIDALQDEILAHTVRINDLDALVARLDEVKAWSKFEPNSLRP